MSIGAVAIIKYHVGIRSGSDIDVSQNVTSNSAEAIVAFLNQGCGKNLRSCAIGYRLPDVIDVEGLRSRPGSIDSGSVDVFEVGLYGSVEVCRSDISSSDRHVAHCGDSEDVLGISHEFAIDVLHLHKRSIAINYDFDHIRSEVVTGYIARYGTQVVHSFSFIGFINQTVSIVVDVIGKRRRNATGKTNGEIYHVVSGHCGAAGKVIPLSDGGTRNLSRVLVSYFDDIVKGYQQFIYVGSKLELFISYIDIVGIQSHADAVNATDAFNGGCRSGVVDVQPGGGAYVVEQSCAIGIDRHSTEFVETVSDLFCIHAVNPRSYREVGKAVGIHDAAHIQSTQSDSDVIIQITDDAIIVQIQEVFEVVITLSQFISV